MSNRIKVVEVTRSYPARQGRKAMTVYLPVDLHYTLSRLALDERSSLQALAEEAALDLLAKRGLKVKKAPSGAD